MRSAGRSARFGETADHAAKPSHALGRGGLSAGLGVARPLVAVGLRRDFHADANRGPILERCRSLCAACRGDGSLGDARISYRHRIRYRGGVVVLPFPVVGDGVSRRQCRAVCHAADRDRSRAGVGVQRRLAANRARSARRLFPDHGGNAGRPARHRSAAGRCCASLRRSGVGADAVRAITLVAAFVAGRIARRCLARGLGRNPRRVRFRRSLGLGYISARFAGRKQSCPALGDRARLRGAGHGRIRSVRLDRRPRRPRHDCGDARRSAPAGPDRLARPRYRPPRAVAHCRRGTAVHSLGGVAEGHAPQSDHCARAAANAGLSFRRSRCRQRAPDHVAGVRRDAAGRRAWPSIRARRGLRAGFADGAAARPCQGHASGGSAAAKHAADRIGPDRSPDLRARRRGFDVHGGAGRIFSGVCAAGAGFRAGAPPSPASWWRFTAAVPQSN